jgi:hypothetical protein
MLQTASPLTLTLSPEGTRGLILSNYQIGLSNRRRESPPTVEGGLCGGVVRLAANLLTRLLPRFMLIAIQLQNGFGHLGFSNVSAICSPSDVGLLRRFGRVRAGAASMDWRLRLLHGERRMCGSAEQGCHLFALAWVWAFA